MTKVLCPFNVQVADPGMRCTNWVHDGPTDARWKLLMPTKHHAAALCDPCYRSLWPLEGVMGVVPTLAALKAVQGNIDRAIGAFRNEGGERRAS